MKRVCVLICVVSFGLLGCGTDEVPDARPDAAGPALIVASDLPGKVSTERGLPAEPCGPTKIFESKRGESAESPMFRISNVRVQEAVGVFPEDGLADLALTALTGRAHEKCIAQAMSFYARPGDRIKLLPSRPIHAGDAAGMFRLRVSSAGSDERGAIAVPSIRTGKCVSALVVLATSESRLRKGLQSVVPAATRALAAAC